MSNWFKTHFSQDKCLGYYQLMRLDRPIGTLLLLYPTLWALFLASNGAISFPILIIFVLGVILMRAAGCVINDYADRHIDGNVKRTHQRPLITGLVTEQEAKGLFITLLTLAFSLVLLLNSYTILLSFIAAGLAIIYPFMKRYTHLPQLILGIAFGWSIPMAFSAVSHTLPLECWILFFANLVWTIAYDTQYAMVDRDDDLRIGVKSTAILFAQYDNKIIASLQMLTLLLFIALGILKSFSIMYYSILIIPTLLFIYQCKLTKKRKREACFSAFLNNNYVGLSFLCAILMEIYLK
ncbi:4-hydroxybenzoate octaprenyltransferase [Pasteurella skyensis]|uniref:4-hydroxybenzoate octaprenyltransferase n=1 Tax=Phocoenobacter skyensis TaxID=97481 RepID=A0AAJ6NAG9_9PAST|nr:4-hydroxybenzoate octaprenyltransferase [Pasteurella skyensis]MDP8162747.1 4-hydroxybenzoate octaprenyltransferase [Pasteurella skyensis]MDP8173218.1 4-hydroxybenzoate octaprenyltransferase [Pasteurella skyensis]MDP8177565.1 4-hydroxybenzoate octaprenyltransferase [Pasteurella skyensis]MDP8178849.1 4-hydroxybenzoate octaprenyltransferase [Pasteurella skyensis]MDP8183149.1 4-hydroxybenzoate octaprenyltransferase [Pasteurella skyensis]